VSRSSFWSVTLAVAWRSIHNVTHNKNLLLPGILFPLLNFTAFAGGLSRVSKLPNFDYEQGYTAFQFVFVLLQSAAFGGVFTGFGIARDFEYGFARRLLLAAPHRTGIIAGYVVTAVFRWLITAVVVTVVAFAVGMNVGGSGVDLFGLFALALLVNVAMLLWACGVAMRFRTIQAGPIMQTPVFLLLFFAPVYVPLGLLRGWIHAVARINPVTYVLEAGRGFVSAEPTGVLVAFAVAFALPVAFSVWAYFGLRSAEAAGA
jgi:ABC-2 type transport system permease protein